MSVSAYRQAHATCAHHPAVVAVRACRKCDEALCEPCCAFVVNDDVWCDSCGDDLQGEGRLARLVGRVALVVGLALVGALVVVAQVRWGRTGLKSLCVGMLTASGVLVQLLRRQRTRYGSRVQHAPRIHRRQPGDALPTKWAFGGAASIPASGASRADRPRA